jgi:hypothetical protein
VHEGIPEFGHDHDFKLHLCILELLMELYSKTLKLISLKEKGFQGSVRDQMKTT